MFVTRRKFEQLQEKVDRLERDIQKRAPESFYLPEDEGPQIGTVVYRWWGESAPSVRVVDAILAMAEHLGLQFTLTPQKPASVAIKAKAKAK